MAVFISAVLFYLALRGADFKRVYELVLDARYIYVLAAFMTLVAVQILRSIRWGVIIHPIKPVNQRLLFPISSIGFMFIALIPARLGEFIRPYLLHQNGHVNMSSAMATVVLERILDAVVILVIFSVIVRTLELPGWIIKGTVGFIIFVFSVITVLLLGTLKWINRYVSLFIYRVLPHGLAYFTETMREKFYQGMRVLGKGRHATIIISLTVAIWGAVVLHNYFLFKALHIPLGTFAAMTVLALTALGVSVPAGPGFIGNYHFFCVLSLSLFGIDKDVGLGYSLVNHALILGNLVLFGIICLNLPGLNVGFKFLKLSIRNNSIN